MSEGYYLLTGGAGYVGSHVLRLLLDRECRCLVLDNLSKGHKEAVPDSVPLFHGDISSEKSLSEIFQSFPIAGILHFAGFIEVAESMKTPPKYFENNVTRGIPLLEAARKYKVPWIVFSSSAAVYGDPAVVPIPEEAEKKPGNVYGWTKLIFEQMLSCYEQVFGIRSISLRYFNASGAHPAGEIGEDHEPESHLVPLACKAALGKVEKLSIYGDDYPTPDGTCVRDYVHVMDLAEAHLAAVKALEAGSPSRAYNLGSGKGYSVREVVAAVERIGGKKIPVETAPRRGGDAAVLVASARRFHEDSGWNPGLGSLEAIIESAWRWHERHPDGFKRPVKKKPVPSTGAHS